MIATKNAGGAFAKALRPPLAYLLAILAAGTPFGCAPAPAPAPGKATLTYSFSTSATPPAPVTPRLAPVLVNDDGPAAARLEFREPEDEKGKAFVDLLGLPTKTLEGLTLSGQLSREQWVEIFAVYVASNDGNVPSDSPALLGEWKVEGPAVRFTPRFPFEPGLRYRAVFRPDGLVSPPSERKGVDPPVELTFALPKPEAPEPTQVVRIDPEGDVLPENLLRFYLHFSAPMSRGEVYRRVHLLDSAGRPVEQPFLEIGEELWDPDGKRLTLLIQPGRIKKGLRPREELGPVLEAGKSYSLVVDAQWPDAAGNPLAHEARKSFRAGEADERQPDPNTWKLEPPAAASAGPLVINLPEPLDRPMLERVLVVQDAEGKEVEGRVSVDQQGKRWRFLPEKPWAAGKYQVVVDTALEDLVGNNIARPFEVDVVRPIETRVRTETVALPFEVAGPSGR